MKKVLMLLILAMAFTVTAGSDHAGREKSELNLTEDQKSAWKVLKKEKHERIMAAKKDIDADYEKQLAKILDNEQLAKYQEMKEHKKEHMAMKKHKKKHKEYKAKD